MPYNALRLGRTLVVSWERIEVADLMRLQREVEGMHRELRAPIVYVSITGSATPSPDDDARKFMVKMLEELLPSLEKFYAIITTEGFKGSMLRSAVTAMSLMSRHRSQIEIANSMRPVYSLPSTVLGIPGEMLRKAVEERGWVAA